MLTLETETNGNFSVVEHYNAASWMFMVLGTLALLMGVGWFAMAFPLQTLFTCSAEGCEYQRLHFPGVVLKDRFDLNPEAIVLADRYTRDSGEVVFRINLSPMPGRTWRLFSAADSAEADWYIGQIRQGLAGNPVRLFHDEGLYLPVFCTFMLIFAFVPLLAGSSRTISYFEPGDNRVRVNRLELFGLLRWGRTYPLSDVENITLRRRITGDVDTPWAVYQLCLVLKNGKSVCLHTKNKGTQKEKQALCKRIIKRLAQQGVAMAEESL